MSEEDKEYIFFYNGEQYQRVFGMGFKYRGTDSSGNTFYVNSKELEHELDIAFEETRH